MSRHAWAVGILVAVISTATVLAPEVFAQDLPLVRRSAAATPLITDRAVIRQQRVEVDVPGGLSDPARSQVLRLDLFADVSFRAVRQELTRTANGVTWSGALEGYPGSSAVFAETTAGVIGHIHAPFGFFRVESRADGGYLVQQIDQSLFPESPDAVPAPNDPTAAQRLADEPPTGAIDDGSVVDVLVAYTEQARAGYGGDAQARAAIDLIVAETNLALRNSGLSHRVRLVLATPVAYAETGSSAIDLPRARLAGDGFMDDLPVLREQYAADLVAVIFERMDDACGRGYLLSPFSSSLFGYSVTARGCTGNGRTFAHELGHNMGATHDWYVSGLSSGAFTYSKGHVSLAGRFMDVMSYSDLCRDTAASCQNWLGFANPSLTHLGQPTGVPVGTGLSCAIGSTGNPPCDSDIVRTFTHMIPIVARFRDSETSIISRRILPGGSIQSTNLTYRLTYQLDGNLVLIDQRAGVALWATHTAGTTPGQLVMQPDGNLVLYDASLRPLWASHTSGNPDAYFILQNDANIVIFTASGNPIWGSGTAR